MMAMAGSKKSKTLGAPSLRIVTGGKGAPPSRHAETQSAGARTTERSARGKRIQFDLETWHALDMLARDRMMSFQELADEAFRDLLRKHGRPVDLKDALRRSLKETEPAQQQRRKKASPRLRPH
jgi:hypothetical protein